MKFEGKAYGGPKMTSVEINKYNDFRKIQSIFSFIYFLISVFLLLFIYFFHIYLSISIFIYFCVISDMSEGNVNMLMGRWTNVHLKPDWSIREKRKNKI